MDQRSIRRNGLWMRVGCSRGQAGKPAAAKFGGNHRRAAARTPIDDRDYQVPFPFQGKLVKLTVELRPLKGTLAQIVDFKWRTRD